MVYIFVLFGSFFGICAILGIRIALRNHNVRRFVRGIRHRTESAEQRGISSQETKSEKPRPSPRTTAVQLQQVRSLLCEAQKYLARSKFEDAEHCLIKALTANPESQEARAELAKLYLSTDRAPKAEAMYRELLRHSNDASCYANLGLSCYRQEKYDDAREAYASALDLDPNNPERSAALGRACIAVNHFKQAVSLLERATERLARDTSLLHLLAECYLQLGHKVQAQETYQRIHKLQPYDDDVKEKMAALNEA